MIPYEDEHDGDDEFDEGDMAVTAGIAVVIFC